MEERKRNEVNRKEKEKKLMKYDRKHTQKKTRVNIFN